MSFYKKYELQRLAHEGEAKVFRASQTASGLQVLLHVFPVNDSTRDLAAEVRRRLATGPTHDLLESGEFAGAIYVVTPPIEGIHDLRAYLHAHPPGAAVPPPPPPVQVAPPPPPPVHFAPPPPPPPAQFAPPPPPPVQFTPPPPPPPPAPLPRSAVQQHPTAHGQEAITQPVEPRRRRRTTEIISHGTVTVGKGPAESSKSGPGDFTRMFSDAPAAQQPAAPTPPAAPLPPSAFAPPPFPAQAAAPAPPPPAPPTHAPASPGPGEFTRLFSGPPQAATGSPFTATPPPPAPHTASPYAAPPAQQAPPPPRDREMADFERIFGPAGGRPFPADEPPPKPQAAESALPSWPQAAPPPPPPSQQAYPPQPTPQPRQPYPPPHAYQPPPPAAPPHTGEFTRFFGSNFSGDAVDVEREQQRAAAEPSTPPRRPFQKASEFTQMFGPGQMGPGEAPPPPPQPRTTANWADQSGAYASMFDARLNTQQPSTRRPTADLTEQAGPSEYTRMIGGGSSRIPGAGLNQDSSALKSGPMPAAGSKQVPGQQPSAPPSRAGQIGLYVAIGGIVIALIVALVLLLTSK